MPNPIVEKILKEGISSVNISMFDRETKKRFLGETGEILYKQGKSVEAIEVLTKAEDIEKLKKYGELFLSEFKPELAALCFIPSKDKEILNKVASLCINIKNYKLAKEAYKAADNKEMVFFVEENFKV
ncbi:hypothetical protein HY500_00180 [Candidatus Woesearchaeota archaeon]|nr:hypothetical protein [Candidatus Woesearchaeota archaeon]